MFNLNVKEIFTTEHTNDGSFLQTPFWGSFKAAHGWKCRRFEITAELPELNAERECEENKDSVNVRKIKKNWEASVLTRTFAKGFFTVAYIPLFPALPYDCTPDEKINAALDGDGQFSVIDESIVTPETQAIEFTIFMKEIADSLKPLLPENTICIRMDPDVAFDTPVFRDDFNYGIKIISQDEHLGIKKNRVDIQPPDSTLVDLTADTEKILSRMKSKWRYNIRLAQKKDVKIEKITGNSVNLSEKLDTFYELYKITAERDGIAIHNKKYYEDLLKSSSKGTDDGNDIPKVTLYIAKHETDFLGAIITLFSKKESVYLYGCSSNVKRNLMPNFLLQWTAMCDAKEYGSRYYDMYGMSPVDDENHPMHGLYQFKTGFGGKNIHRIGSYDIPTSWIYGLYGILENARAFWHKKVMKKFK